MRRFPCVLKPFIYFAPFQIHPLKVPSLLAQEILKINRVGSAMAGNNRYRLALASGILQDSAAAKVSMLII